MKNNKKKNSKMKQMSSSFKQGLMYFFKGIISNAASYEGAKTTPWWVASIIATVSIIIATIPTMVFYGNRTGFEQISSTTNQGLEVVFTDFVIDLVKSDASTDPINLSITKDTDSEGKEIQVLTDTDNSWNNRFGWIMDGSTEVVGFNNPWTHERAKESATGLPVDPTDTIVDFEIYFMREIKNPTTEREEYNKQVSYIRKGLQADGSQRPLDYYEPILDEEGNQALDNDGKPQYDIKLRNSFIFFSRSFFTSYIFNRNGIQLLEYTSGQYDKMVVGTNLQSLGNVTIGGENLTALDFIAPDSSLVSKVLDYQNGVQNNFRDFYNTSFLTIKWNTFWAASAITFAVFIAFIAILALVIFLMTRGTKKRPQIHVFSFLDSLKMVCWLSFTPGVIALLGFLMPQFSSLFFIIPMTVRVIFFGMRTLGPGGAIGGTAGNQAPSNAPLPRGRG